MVLRFTNKMVFPDGLVEELVEDERRRLEGEIDHEEGLNVELVYFPGVEDPMKSEIDLIWELKSITPDAINLLISFQNPIEVSQDVEPDFVLVQVYGFERF